MAEEEELNQSLEYTPTWIVAVVCSVIVFISLCVERALHRLGKVNQHILSYFCDLHVPNLIFSIMFSIGMVIALIYSMTFLVCDELFI